MVEQLLGKEEDMPSREALAEVLQVAQRVIDDQAVEIHQLRKQLFGRRSEKVARQQLSLFAQSIGNIADEAQEVAAEEPKADADKATEEPKAKEKKPKTQRRKLQVTRSEEISIAAEDRPCPTCGKDRCTLGHVRTIVVEYQPPKIEVIEYLREKVVCRPCDGEIELAPPPRERIIDRALPGPNMLSALIVNKGCDGLPLHRSRRRFKRAGLDISAGTLSRWEGFAHQLLTPIVQRVRAKVLESDVINLDDTGLRVRDPKAEGGVVKGHIWAFVGRTFDPEGDLAKTIDHVFYLYAPTWEAKHPEAFLEGCPAALQGDAYRGYERIASAHVGDGVEKLLAGCCMHARRAFVQALEASDPAAPFFIERFQEIYRVESQAKQESLTVDARLELRKQSSLPIMNEIYERAKALSDLPLLKPMKTGVTYFVNQWEKLKVPFARDGRLEIDNGIAERYLRRVASGRKAWLFAGSEGGAHRFADMLSLVSSCDAAGVDAGGYLPSVIGAVDTWPNRRIDELLPHAWQAALEEILRQQDRK